VDCQLDLVGGEAKVPPGRVSHWERTIEWGCEGVKIWCEGSRWGGRVGDEERDRTSIIDLSCDTEGESAVTIPEDAGGDVGEGGSDQGGLRVFSEGGTKSVEHSFSCKEWLRLLQSRDRVKNGHDFRGCGGVLILLVLRRDTGRGSLGVRGLGLGAVRVKMARDERGWVWVFAVAEGTGFP